MIKREGVWGGGGAWVQTFAPLGALIRSGQMVNEVLIKANNSKQTLGIKDKTWVRVFMSHLAIQE